MTISAPSRRGFSALRFRRSASLLALGAGLLLQQASAAGWAATATRTLPSGVLAGAAALPASTTLRISLPLALQNKAALDAFAEAVNTSGSPVFGRYLTPQQFTAHYAPSAAQANAVVAYLNAQGFSHVALASNRLLITAEGSAAAVEHAFNTHMVQLADGAQHYANSLPAQVPAALGGVVSAVLGLQNLAGVSTQLQHRGAAHPSVGLPANLLSSFTPQAYQAAYNASGTPTGSGTSIGIVTEGDLSQVTQDLRTFEAQYGLPQVPYQIVPTEAQTTDTSGIDEWDLDSQSSSGIAGDLRQIIFYNAGSLSDADLQTAYNQVVADAQVKAVNMSFGGCEALMELSGATPAADAAFEAGAAEGITFFAASGDAGASCSLLLPNAGQPVVLGSVEYPAASPWVVAVGGTSLFVNADGSYDLEAAWLSGGGGISLFESAPSWQTPVAPVINRGVPDMAMDADANLSPADVVVSGAVTSIGGTSLATPLAVGGWARMQSAHANCYGFAAPLLYQTFGTSLLKAATGFHDIVIGFNYLYPATPGWDYTTGLGSFDIGAVNQGLPACP